jgi:hypothetical protein
MAHPAIQDMSKCVSFSTQPSTREVVAQAPGAVNGLIRANKSEPRFFNRRIFKFLPCLA